jgi:hypothetical protein
MMFMMRGIENALGASGGIAAAQQMEARFKEFLSNPKKFEPNRAFQRQEDHELVDSVTENGDFEDDVNGYCDESSLRIDNNRSIEDDVEVDDDSATSPKVANQNAMNLFNFTNFNSPNFHMQYDYTAPIARNTPENNQVRLIDYRNQKVASFTVDAKELICLPQAFEFFLKALVGGLHTVYTKLKRLDIVPIVCNVEQVSANREVNSILLFSYFFFCFKGESS